MSGATTSIAVESAKRAVRTCGAPAISAHEDAALLSALHHTIDEEAHTRGVELSPRIDALTRALAICIAKACRDHAGARALMKSANMLATGQLETLLAMPRDQLMQGVEGS